jgi:hypothetical protein
MGTGNARRPRIAANSQFYRVSAGAGRRLLMKQRLNEISSKLRTNAPRAPPTPIGFGNFSQKIY